METFTLGIALLGAVLGVVNTWNGINRERVKLRVMPQNALAMGVAAQMFPGIEFSIEVVNLSAFPIVVQEVGFLHRGLSSRAAVIQPITLEGTTTPRKLGPREAVSFYMPRPERRGKHSIESAYVRTACGRIFKGSSPALRQYNRDEI